MSGCLEMVAAAGPGLVARATVVLVVAAALDFPAASSIPGSDPNARWRANSGRSWGSMSASPVSPP